MAGDWYSVYIEARAPKGMAVAVNEDAPDLLMGLLEEHSGVVPAHLPQAP